MHASQRRPVLHLGVRQRQHAQITERGQGRDVRDVVSIQEEALEVCRAFKPGQILNPTIGRVETGQYEEDFGTESIQIPLDDSSKPCVRHLPQFGEFREFHFHASFQERRNVRLAGTRPKEIPPQINGITGI